MSNSNPFSEIFPMPMTSIEKFYWFDNHPDYPNMIFWRMRIIGRLEEEASTQAWYAAVKRQPFADVEPQKINGSWHWNQCHRPSSNTDETQWQPSFSFETLTERPPANRVIHRLRSATSCHFDVVVWSTPDQEHECESEVILCVHHAICDGPGGLQVANDWLTAYANLTNGRPIEKGLHRLDASTLVNRNKLGLSSWRYLKHLWKQPIALFGATKFVLRKTAELTNANFDDSVKDTYPEMQGMWLDTTVRESIGNEATKHGVMKNSIYLGQLFLALSNWRSKNVDSSQKDWMRVILPISIRNISDRRLPSANKATIVQIDRRPLDHSDIAKFYQGIDHEVGVIRGWQLDKIFLIAVRLLSLFEPLLRSSATSKKSRGMAVFANLGEPFRQNRRDLGEDFNGFPILENDLVGPIRYKTPVNFSVATIGNRLRLSLHYDAKLLTDEQASDLIETYAERLSQL